MTSEKLIPMILTPCLTTQFVCFVLMQATSCQITLTPKETGDEGHNLGDPGVTAQSGKGALSYWYPLSTPWKKGTFCIWEQNDENTGDPDKSNQRRLAGKLVILQHKPASRTLWEDAKISHSQAQNQRVCTLQNTAVNCQSHELPTESAKVWRDFSKCLYVSYTSELFTFIHLTN